jgi:hypothetical protein
VGWKGGVRGGKFSRELHAHHAHLPIVAGVTRAFFALTERLLDACAAIDGFVGGGDEIESGDLAMLVWGNSCSWANAREWNCGEPYMRRFEMTMSFSAMNSSMLTTARRHKKDTGATTECCSNE